MQTNLSQPTTGGPMRRRSFLKGALLAGAATAFVPRLVLGASSTGKVNVACIGIGNRGADDVKALYATGLANIVALCDTDMGAPHTLEILKQFPDVPRFHDFRQMFDKMGGQFDAVSVGVPDFSHFAITMLAMSLGKHVYCEKPMGLTFQQVELMIQAEKKYRVAAQMGNQGHSEANYFQFKAWTEAGIIKNVTKITAFMNGARRWHGMHAYDFLNEQPVLGTLDWNVWLTTAQFHNYNVGYTHGDWRSWYDFGNGALGDWGAHIFDTAHEFLKMGLPEEIDPVKLDGYNQFIFPQASTLRFKFPAREGMPPLEMTWYDGVHNLPPLPADFGGAVVDPNIPPPTGGNVGRTLAPGKVIYGEGLTFKGGSHGSTLQIIPKSKAEAMAARLPVVPKSPSNHWKNFLLACRGEETCRSSFAVAGPLSQVLVLGVLAQRMNVKLAFDRSTKQITNHKVANELLAGVPPRPGWEQYYRL